MRQRKENATIKTFAAMLFSLVLVYACHRFFRTMMPLQEATTRFPLHSSGDRHVADHSVANPNLHVVTIISRGNETDTFQTMLRIAQKFGVSIEVVLLQHYEGNWMKLLAARDYCAKLVAAGNGTDIVLFTDAFDAVMTGPPAAILQRYHVTVQHQQKLLFSAETHCYPGDRPACKNNGAWYTASRPTNTTFRYLNSGGWMGPAYLALLMINDRYNFTDSAFPKHLGDQALWQDILVDSVYKEAIVLDHQAAIFRSLFVTEGDMACNPELGWLDRNTQQFPFQFHSNGNPKVFFERVLLPSFAEALQLPQPVTCPDPHDGRWCSHGPADENWQKDC